MDNSHQSRPAEQQRRGLANAVVNVSFFAATYYAIDLQFLNTLAEYMDFQTRLVSPADGLDYGYMVSGGGGGTDRRCGDSRSDTNASMDSFVAQEEDGTFTGALGDLLAHRTDIIANAFFIKDYGSDELRFSSALAIDRLCIVVRTAERVCGGGGGVLFYRFNYVFLEEIRT